MAKSLEYPVMTEQSNGLALLTHKIYVRALWPPFPVATTDLRKIASPNPTTSNVYQGSRSVAREGAPEITVVATL